MKKIITFTILAALILVVCSPITFAGNPPGLFVRDDGQSEDTPWNDLESIIPEDDGSDISQIQAIDISDEESKDFIDYILLLISPALYLKVVFEDNTASKECNESIY